ncbi:MAG: ShlB/FhaC/HecB family hemolysin secretion/activation protein [Nitrospinae bacterium]|nr:ShlB/FhaC/HecB family hemolysin secretion/activation protein [Nitrospinota bacterium]
MAIPDAGKSGVAEKFLEKPPQILPPAQTKPPEIVIEDSRELEDAGAGPAFFVKRIDIEGNTIFDGQTLAPLVDVGDGMEITLGILTLMANEVSSFYASNGYFLTRAYIPRQEILDGVVRMAVAEGRLGKIEVKGNESIKTQDLLKRMDRIRREPVLREQTLERTLLELNDLMGVNVRSVLKPGDLPGTSDLVLDVTEAPPYAFSFDADNFGSRFTGRNRFGVSAAAGNLAVLGDQFFFRGVRSDLNQSFAGPSYVLPLTEYGTTLKAAYIFSGQNLGENLAELSAGGETQLYQFELGQPVYRSKNAQIKIAAAFDYKKSDNFLLNQLSSRDETRYLRFGLNGNFGDRFLGRSFFDVSWQQGIGSHSGAVPTSRAEGNGDIFASKFNVTRFQGTGILKSYFIFKVSGQAVDRRALSVDLFSIGGYGSVRGYPLGEFLGDQGYAVSLEQAIPFPWAVPVGFGNLTLDNVLSFNGFIDHGGVIVKNPQAGENDEYLTGVGGAVTVNIPKFQKWTPASSFSLGYAAPQWGPQPTDGRSHTWYLNGALSFVF